MIITINCIENKKEGRYKMNEIKNEKQALIMIVSNLQTMNETMSGLLKELQRIEHEMVEIKKKLR